MTNACWIASNQNEWPICNEGGVSTGPLIPDCDTDTETGWLIGLSGTMAVIAGIVGSTLTDGIGVRKSSLIALTIALMGRTLWSFGDTCLNLSWQHISLLHLATQCFRQACIK